MEVGWAGRWEKVWAAAWGMASAEALAEVRAVESELARVGGSVPV